MYGPVKRKYSDTEYRVRWIRSNVQDEIERPLVVIWDWRIWRRSTYQWGEMSLIAERMK